MPLLVHCPNHCQIRVPADRAGKVIRCPQCMSPIKIPIVDSSLLSTGNWVECRANRAIKKNAVDHLETSANPPSAAKLDSEEALPLPPPANRTPLLRAKPWRIVEPLTVVNPEQTPISIDDAKPS